MRFGRRLIRTSAAACLILVGCASTTSSVGDNGEAATALRAAVEKTLRVDSFHAQSTFQEPAGQGPATGTIDYQAPDREQDRFGSGKREHETISIGDTVYVTATNKPGFFWKIAGRGIGGTSALMYFHLMEHADNVRLDGDLYHFDLPSADMGGPGQGPTSGTVTLTDDGLLHTLLLHVELRGGEADVGFTYSGYNAGITVEAPSPDLIVKTPLIGCPNSVPPPSGVLPKGSDICSLVASSRPSP
jgi:hypothetical protein